MSIIQIRELEVTDSEFSKLSLDVRGALGAISHAVNELNVLKRLFLFSVASDPPESDFRISFHIQEFTILRLWSAKLFELQEFLEFSGKYNRSNDPTLRETAIEAKATFMSLKAQFGYEITKRFRHEATNHLSLKETKENLSFLSEYSKCLAFLTSEDGNSFFPYGEDAVFGGGLARHSSHLSLELRETLDSWFKWNSEANRWATVRHSNFIAKVCELISVSGKTSEVALEDRFMSTPDGLQIPIFTVSR